MKVSKNKLIWTVLALVITVFFSSSQAFASKDLAHEVRHAEKALAAGDYEKAFNEYSVLAGEKNNPLAQFTLALFYQNGWGRSKDQEQACQWFAKAAAADIPAAQHFYANCLNEGTGQPADPVQAATWYEKAAELGHILSLCSLGDLYITGKGVSKNPAKGLGLCRQAAEQGALPAQIKVGRLLLEGEESIRDYKEAEGWLQIAAQRNAPEAYYFLGMMTRDGLGKQKNPLIARNWFERAASQGYLPAYLPTGQLYFAPSGEPQGAGISEHELAKAYMWLSAAVKRLPDGDELLSSRKMLTEVMAIMPESWVEELDAKVAKHLAEFEDQPEQ